MTDDNFLTELRQKSSTNLMTTPRFLQSSYAVPHFCIQLCYCFNLDGLFDPLRQFLISAFGFEPLAHTKWPLVVLRFQTLGVIDICEIYTRFANTKRMVDLVNLPNARYN